MLIAGNRFLSTIKVSPRYKKSIIIQWALLIPRLRPLGCDLAFDNTIKLLSFTHSKLRNKKGKWIKMCVPLCMQKEVGLATQVKLNHKLRTSKIVSISSSYTICVQRNWQLALRRRILLNIKLWSVTRRNILFKKCHLMSL